METVYTKFFALVFLVGLFTSAVTGEVAQDQGLEALRDLIEAALDSDGGTGGNDGFLAKAADDKGQTDVEPAALGRALNEEHLMKDVAGEDTLDVQSRRQNNAGCPSGYTAHGDACFKAYNQEKTYDQARQVCAADGGLLAMPKNEDLDNFLWDLKNAVDRSSLFWFGLNDENSESEWRWEDGTPHDPNADWNNWRPGEPNQAGNEDCAHYWGEQYPGWNDLSCSGSRKFICQIGFSAPEATPATAEPEMSAEDTTPLLPGPKNLIAAPATTPVTTPKTAYETEPKTATAPESAPVTAAPEMSASTTCTNDYMELSIPDDQLTDINLSNLHWEPDRSCVATTNGTHFLFRTDLYGCGTQVSFDSRYVTFRNTIDILGTHKTTGVITREGDIRITSICKYERLEWVDSTFLPIPGGLNFTEEGFGQLEVHLSMFPTRQYQSQYRANQYPIHLKLRQNIYMQLEVQGHGQNLAVLALNCKATMTPEPNGSPQYELIKDGCASDPTLDIYSIQDPTKERFGFEAFRFVQEVKMVYVHCEVMVCDAADDGSRCAQGCVKRGKRAAGENVDMKGRHMIYQGPIMLDEDKEDSNSLRLVDAQESAPRRRSAPWAMMVAGGGLMALTIVALGAAIVLKRSRREEWAYQRLVNMEEQE